MTLVARPNRRWRRPLEWSVVGACSLLLAGHGAPPVAARAAPAGGYGTLVQYDALSNACLMPAALQRAAWRREAPALAGQAGAAPRMLASAIRTIKDPYPSFAAVAVDPERNEVVFTDESLFQVLVYDRLENTRPELEASTPTRVLAGKRTNIEFQSGVYVDPKSGAIYTVNNDTRDTTLVFGAGASGNVAPVRGIKTPHGTFGIAVAEPHDEVLLTVQHDAAIVTYRKTAAEKDSPIRLLQGDKTQLADPHGIAYDPLEDVIFVANFGSRAQRSDEERRPGRPGENSSNWPLGRNQAVPGSGTISDASITVYRRSAAGNEAPLRVIKGPATQFNWPTGVAFDPERRELYVSNDVGASVLVFDEAASGDAAPKRILRGPRTGLKNPTGVALDPKNGELWVANFGGHSATVYDLTAEGDTPPLRTIRNAPPDAPSLMIGNPGAVTYDTKRQEILVPN